MNKIPWTKYVYFVFLSLISALGNMGVVYTINKIVKDYFTNTPVLSSKYFLYFFCSLVFFVICRWFFSMGIIKFTQKQLLKTRLTVLRMVLRSSYPNLIKNKSQVYTALTRDTDNVVGASINFVDILTNTIVIIICLIYMSALSWKLLLCMIGLMLFTLAVYYLGVKRAAKFFKLAMEQNDRFVKYLNEILLGFKEISIEQKKGREIAQRHIDKAITGLSQYNQKAHITFLNNRIIGQIAFYVFIGMVLLSLGGLFSIEKSILVNFVFLILYIWGPIETVVMLIPALSQAKTSEKRIEKLETQINESNPVVQEEIIYGQFRTLVAKDICYQYLFEEDKEVRKGFNIGSIDFQIDRSDAIFICGGNGSGKTTFINILIGLLKADEGQLYINGNPVLHPQSNGYKSQFSPLFSDFHLFDEVYGVPNVDYQKANEYLKLFEVEQKVTFENGKFSDINVSTGQRKRLALISAMLEQKPVLVLDEFAADQDPGFKRKFYSQIIPYLKNEGFTLIVITHDDNYYQYADKLYKMDGGKLFEVSTESQALAQLVV